MTSHADSVAAYHQTQERIVALLRQASPDQLQQPVPACPDWSAEDLLAHVTGAAVDVVAGRIEGAGSDRWTATQVQARSGAGLEALLAEWTSASAPLEQALLALDPVQAAQVVFDLATHEHDLRGALELPGERDSAGVQIGWEWATTVLGQLRDGYGEGALVLTTEQDVTTCGASEPTSGVTADRFELWRAMTGRRSAEQVSSWAWTGEPAVERLCLLPARATPLQE